MPAPRRITTPLTQPFWDAADAGELLMQVCGSCDRAQLYPGALCRVCWSTSLHWRAAAGTGTVWSLTVAEVPGHPAWQDQTPYCLAIIELDEGPRMLSNVIGCDPYDVKVGQRVRLAPNDVAGEGPPLRFMPC